MFSAVPPDERDNTSDTVVVVALNIQFSAAEKIFKNQNDDDHSTDLCLWNIVSQAVFRLPGHHADDIGVLEGIIQFGRLTSLKDLVASLDAVSSSIPVQTQGERGGRRPDGSSSQADDTRSFPVSRPAAPI